MTYDPCQNNATCLTQQDGTALCNCTAGEYSKIKMTLVGHAWSSGTEQNSKQKVVSSGPISAKVLCSWVRHFTLFVPPNVGV